MDGPWQPPELRPMIGHAVQHATVTLPCRSDKPWCPSRTSEHLLAFGFVVIGMMLGMTGLAKLGVGLFAAFVLFTVVTLPVEIDASRRATAALASTSIIAPHEMTGVRQVLSAAAATYLAAAVELFFNWCTGLLELAYRRAGRLSTFERLDQGCR